MAQENSNSGAQFEEEIMSLYKKDALSTISFKIHYSSEDYNRDRFIEFKPEMAHQVFGENESIFGYRYVSIILHYLHNSSNCYVEIDTSGEIKHEVHEPDDILKSLNPWLPENYTTSSQSFLEMLYNEKHDIYFGNVLKEFPSNGATQLYPDKKVSSKYLITLCDATDEKFKDFHQRFETFIVWFIDAANFIDLDDERWVIFYIYEDFEHPISKKRFITPIGFCTAYKFFLYPNNIRARISQFIILPSHQGQGIGTQFYKEVVAQIRKMPTVIDITVEEPIAKFQRIRDLDDSLIIYNKLIELNWNFKICSRDRIIKMMRECKICRRQCHRLYDILGCYYFEKSTATEYKQFLDGIKERISSELEKDSKGSKRLRVSGITASEPSITQASKDEEFKKYFCDIEPSIKSLHKELDK